MSTDDYQRLKDDIAKNGLKDEIVMHEGKVLDGRHRLQACQELKLEIRVTDFDKESGSPLDYVISKNVSRRHLTPSQLAAIATDLLQASQQEAKERQRHHGGTAPGRKAITPGKSSQSDAGRARDQAARKVGANPKYVDAAQKIKRQDPEMFEKVKDGSVNINQAKKAIKEHASGTVIEVPVSTKNTKTRSTTPSAKWKRRWPPGRRPNSNSINPGYGVPYFLAGATLAILAKLTESITDEHERREYDLRELGCYMWDQVEKYAAQRWITDSFDFDRLHWATTHVLEEMQRYPICILGTPYILKHTGDVYYLEAGQPGLVSSTDPGNNNESVRATAE
jgi:hypothetical protein